MVLQQLIPKSRREELVINLQRILQPVTDFIRGNPIVSTAAIGAGITGLVTAVAVVRKRRAKKRKVIKRRKRIKKDGRRKRRKVGRRKVGRPKGRGKVTHRSPRHKGHKRVGFTTASGKRVSFLVRKKGGVKHRRKRRK